MSNDDTPTSISEEDLKAAIDDAVRCLSFVFDHTSGAQREGLASYCFDQLDQFRPYTPLGGPYCLRVQGTGPCTYWSRKKDSWSYDIADATWFETFEEAAEAKPVIAARYLGGHLSAIVSKSIIDRDVQVLAEGAAT